MKFVLKKIFPFLVLLNTTMSITQWSRVSFSNTTSLWIVNFLIISIGIVFKLKYFNPNNLKDYKIITFYFVWMLIGAVRGLFVPENYWEWKQFVDGCQTLSLPVFVYIFTSYTSR